MDADRLVFEQGPQAGQVAELSDRPLVLGRAEDADIVIAHTGVSRRHARITREAAAYRIEDLGSTNGTFINEDRLRASKLLADGDRVRLGTEVVLRLELAKKAEATVIVRDGGSQPEQRTTKIAQPPADIQPAPEPALSPAATQLVRPAAAQTSPTLEQPAVSATQLVRPAAPPSAPAAEPKAGPAVPARLSITLPNGQTAEHDLTAETIALGRLNDNDLVVNVPIISRRHLTLQRQGGDYWLRVEPHVANPVIVNGEQVHDPRLLRDGDQVSLGYAGGDMTVLLRYHAEVAQPSALPPAKESGEAFATRTHTASGGPDEAFATRIGQPASPSTASHPAPSDAGQTMMGQAFAPAAAVPPQLVITSYGKTPMLYSLTQDRIRIGRAPDNDIVLDNRFVSRFHAEIERRGLYYFIVPAPSVGNPLVLDGVPVMEATRLQHGAKLRLGGFDPGEMVTLVFLSPADEPSLAQQRTIQFSESKVISIGRDKENDIVLPAPTVSRIHAQVERIGQRYRVRDLHSSNGTFVNGQAIQGDTWVTPGDAIHIGPYRLQVGDEHITQLDESQGGMRVEAHELQKWVRKDLNVLQDISLAFQPREFIVVVGQSGGGKSTLVDAIAGYRPATHGRVIVNDTIDVYKNFDAIRNTLGYVPQKDIIHMELTVFQALDYAAQLRMPADTTRQERVQRISEVLEELDLTHRRDTQISELSGGQQKRVSIGVELLNKPGLFFLDEPTSGLDPGTETELMQLMRRLADQGRTIVLITHATKNVMLADRVVFLARGGYLAWFGPPEEALTYFDQFRSDRERRTKPIEFDDIYNLLDRPEHGSAEDWAARFRKHDAYQRFITQPLSEDRPTPLPQAQAAHKGGPVRRQVSALRQFLILSARSMKILTRDRATLGLMLLSAPLMAALDFVLAFGVGRNPFGFNGGDFNNVIVTLIVLTNTAILVGGLVMMRELVKEREIYKRERMVNLHLSSYIFSKLWFALLLAMYQSFWFTLIRYLAFDMPGGTPEVFYFFITVFLMVAAGMMMGLFTSAVAPNANAAPLILVLFILPQVVLSGALVPLPAFASAPASSHWAFQGAIAISGIGSDVAGDACWVDLTADERKALTLDEKDQRCACMGVNAVRQSSCNFPGLGQFYDPAVDQPEPVKPADPGPQPEAPVFPDAPEKPSNLNDPQALQDYLKALDDYNKQVTDLRKTFEGELNAYRAKTDAYKSAIEDYQTKLTDYETDRATAVGSAEALIKRFYDDYGWTFVNKKDRSAYLGTVLKTWAAQLIIITVCFMATVIVQKARDVR